MDQTNCSAGWATDKVFIFDVQTSVCDMPIPAFLFFGVLIICSKYFVVYKHVTLWIARRKKLHILRDKRIRTHVPFIPLIGIISALAYTLFWILVSLNVATADNGWAPALYSIGWTCMGSFSLFYRRKINNLGKRIAPFMFGKARPEVQTSQDTGEIIQQADRLELILLIAETLCIIIQFILFFIILVFITNNLEVFIGGLIVCGSFLFIFSFSILYQIEKTIRAMDLKGSPNSAEIRVIVQRMRMQVRGFLHLTCMRRMELTHISNEKQQLVICVIAVVSSLVYLLIVTRVISTAWYIIMIHMLFDTIANVAIVFTFSAKSRKKKLAGNVKVEDFKTDGGTYTFTPSPIRGKTVTKETTELRNSKEANINPNESRDDDESFIVVYQHTDGDRRETQEE